MAAIYKKGDHVKCICDPTCTMHGYVVSYSNSNYFLAHTIDRAALDYIDTELPQE